MSDLWDFITRDIVARDETQPQQPRVWVSQETWDALCRHPQVRDRVRELEALCRVQPRKRGRK